MKLRFLALCGLMLTWVSASVSHSQTIHPSADLFPSADEVIRVSSEQDSMKQRTFPSSANHITIGQNKNEPPIAGVTEVAKIGDQFLVLDQKSNEVKVYSETGEYMYAFGRPGQGPGELKVPEDMDRDHQGRIWVADADRSISVFSKQNGRYKALRTFSVDKNPQGICVIGESLYVYGFSPSKKARHPITEYSFEGDRGRTFGSAYESEHPAVSNRLSEISSMTCREDGKIILHYRYLPLTFVENISSSGDDILFLYERQKSVDIRVMKDGRGVRYGQPDVGTHLGGSVSIQGDKILVNKRYISNKVKKMYDIFVIYVQKRELKKYTRHKSEIVFLGDEKVQKYDTFLKIGNE